MELGIILTYAAIIGGICTIANFLDGEPTIFKSKLISLLKKSRSSDIVKLSEVFIIIFNYFYCKKNSKSIKRQNYLWAWLIISFIVTLGFGLIGLLFDQPIGVLGALVLGLFLGTGLFILYTIFIGTENDIPKLTSFWETLLILINPPEGHPLNIRRYTAQPTIKNCILDNYIIALCYAIGWIILVLLLRFIYPWFVIHCEMPTMFFMEMNFNKYILLMAFMSVFIFIIIFYLNLFFSLTFYFISKHHDFFKISPIRTIITSLIAIGLLTLLFKEAAYSFIADFEQFGWLVLIYLFLNIFADSFSILETHYVLQVASLGTPKRFPGILTLDLLASGFIFLIIPLMAGNLNIFLAAIWFKGDSPWLGILFWSTFSTSACFYLYLISFYVLATLHRYSIIDEKHLPITTKPFWSLGFVMMITFTIAYIIILLSSWSISFVAFVVIVFILIGIVVWWYFKKVKPSIVLGE